MGNNLGWATGHRERKSEKRKKAKLIASAGKIKLSFSEKIFWLAVLLITGFFFIDSLNLEVYLENWLVILLEAALLLISLLSLYFSLKDRNSAKTKNLRKKQLKALFFKQRKILKSRFDLKNKLGDLPLSSDSESLNFAELPEDPFEEEVLTEKEIEEELPSPSGKVGDSPTAESINLSEVNLVNKLVNGEDISSFPPEWRQFFIENEDKTTVEKLNILLAFGKNNKNDKKANSDE